MGKKICKGGCGARTTASGDFCRSCQSKMHHGAKRAEAEGILVDFAGGAAWAWDKLGNVLAGPAESKGPIWIELSAG